MSWMNPFRGPRGRVVERSGSEIVGIILAIGIAAALNTITFALVWDVLTSQGALNPLSENTTQVLTGWGGGMLGVLGAYVGYTFGRSSTSDGGPGSPDVEEEPPPPGKPPPSKSRESVAAGQAVDQHAPVTTPTKQPPAPIPSTRVSGQPPPSGGPQQKTSQQPRP
jgi:hypothetical protein